MTTDTPAGRPDGGVGAGRPRGGHAGRRGVHHALAGAAAGAPAVAPDPARDFTPAQIARSETFDALVSVPGYLSLGLTLVFAGLLVATPLGRAAAGPAARAVVAAGAARRPGAVDRVAEALRWPLGIWSETVLRDFGLSTQTWAGWTGRPAQEPRRQHRR